VISRKKYTQNRIPNSSLDNSVLSVGVQSEALFSRAKLRFELQRNCQNRLAVQSFALNSNETVKIGWPSKASL
jgi:hypothetical protein